MQISVGIDAAKEVHWATAVAQDGRVLLNRKVDNTAEDIGRLIAELHPLGGERLVGIDLLGSIATLISAMLIDAGERLVHVPGLAVNRARQGSVSGLAKSDPKDARIIADQLRLRPADFRPILLQDEAIAELRLLVSRRTDLVVDQTRRISRMRYLLNTIHPDLERVLDLTNAGPLLLLTRYVTAAQIRAAKPKVIVRFLRSKDVRHPEALADAVYAAALAHPNIRLPAELATASLVREMAEEAVIARTRLAAIDRKLAELVQAHPDGALIRSLPGMGVVLTAELLAEAGDFDRFRSAAALASAAGLAPVLRQSGKSRHLQRPGYANNRLKRVFYQSAFCSLADPLSRAFYARKRREGKRHHQAIIALARRRIDVLWALLTSPKPFCAEHPKAA
ncbi:MAG: IS110 family transposase [Geminicoccaceae bacterium]